MMGLIGSVGELTPAQLAQRSGVAVSALHFYERQGLIRSRRTPGNQRRYAREMLRRVAFIRVSQRVGIPLAEIRAALDTLPEGGLPAARIGRAYRHSGAPIWTSASSSSSGCVTIYPGASAAVVSRSIAVCCSIPMTCSASKVPVLASSPSSWNDAQPVPRSPATIVAINPLAGRGGGNLERL